MLVRLRFSGAKGNDVSVSLEIIRAEPKHVPAIARLADLVWREHYPGIISQAQIDYMLVRMYDLDVIRKDLVDGVVYNCLFSGAELAGFSAHAPAGKEMKLHKLYVHPAHQRRGLGSKLLKAVEQDTIGRGFETLILAVNKANEQAINAYRRNGFNFREPVTTNIGNGFVMDDYVMVKLIGDRKDP